VKGEAMTEVQGWLIVVELGIVALGTLIRMLRS
jgi:hypothetical protein